jgi:riboflavin kinase/FMN adenylyltransferase
MQCLAWPQFLENGLPKYKRTSMTVGIFDGVHRGHQALIKRIVSHNAGYAPVIVTFRNNHKTNNKYQGDILTFQQKMDKLQKLGIQLVIVIDFTKEFMQMDGIKFLKILLRHGNVGFFAAGSDFRCGYELKTGAAEIQRFFASNGIPAEVVPQVMEGSLPISSSRIRSAIAAGDAALAEKMLG